MIIIIQLEHLFPLLGPNLCKVATFPSNFCPLAKIKILLKNICISILYLNMQSQFLNIKYAVQNPEYYIPNTKMPSKIQNTTSPYTKYAVQYPISKIQHFCMACIWYLGCCFNEARHGKVKYFGGWFIL